MQQITNRKNQEAVCLLASSECKKWTGKIVNASSFIYAIVSGPWNGAITLTWLVETGHILIPAQPGALIKMEIYSLSRGTGTNVNVPFDQPKRKPSAAGLMI